MEADPSALVEVLLSPPFLCWLSRDDVSPHTLLVAAVWGHKWTVIPWSARIALAAGALVAGSLLYYRLCRQAAGTRVEDGTDAKTISRPTQKQLRQNMPSTQDDGCNHDWTYTSSSPPLSPLTPRVTIFPSRYPHPRPSSPHYTTTSPPNEATDEFESEGAVISFLDSDSEGDHETTPITLKAPPTTSGNQATVEFSLLYAGGSDQSDEEEEEEKSDDSLTWSRPEEEGQEQEEIVSQTFVTAL